MHGYESVEHREFMPYLSKFPRQQWCRDDVLCLVFFHKFDVQAPEVHTQPLASEFATATSWGLRLRVERQIVARREPVPWPACFGEVP
jgi:hypothetical protein